MVGRFEGLSDLEWKLFEDIFPTSFVEILTEKII